MKTRLLSLPLLGLWLVLADAAVAQGPIPTPSTPPAPGQPLTPNSIPSSRGRRFPFETAQLAAGLMDANANVMLITPDNLVDVRQNFTLTPRQTRNLARIVANDPRLLYLAGQLTQALRNRGFLNDSQMVLGVIQDRVFVVTGPVGP